MKNFALIGAAGFVAPRHMRAIKEIGGKLVVALDPHDSVGILDSYFPECLFFTEFERFDRHCEKLKKTEEKINYVSICSPNYLHDAHCRFALRIGADAICEKPLVLRERNLDPLKELEFETGNRIYTIMQLRLNPKVIELKKTISEKIKYKVKVEYTTPRGLWYDYSWKGDIGRSGGVVVNIGFHLFDLLLWLFGEVASYYFYFVDEREISGKVNFSNAQADFHLSLKSGNSYKVLIIEEREVNREINLFQGFEELHTACYQEILDGKGFGIEEVRPTIKLCGQMIERK